MTKSETREGQTLVQILEEAIKKEHDSYEYYSTAAKQPGKPTIKNMLLNLAEMEKGHITELNKILVEIKAQTIVDSAITGGS